MRPRPRSGERAIGYILAPPGRSHLRNTKQSVEQIKFHFHQRVQSAPSSTEVFDPQTNAWTPLAPMSTGREAPAMAAVQGKLYAVGGVADGSALPVLFAPAPPAALATAEAYDPQQNRWEAVAPMAQARHSFGAAAI